MKKNDPTEEPAQTNPGKPQVTFLVLADNSWHSRHNNEEEAIAEAIAATGAQGQQDMGKVMALLKPKLAGRADMGKVSSLVKAKLSA